MVGVTAPHVHVGLSFLARAIRDVGHRPSARSGHVVICDAIGTRGNNATISRVGIHRERASRCAAVRANGVVVRGPTGAIMKPTSCDIGGRSAHFEPLEARQLMSTSSFYVQTNLVSDNGVAGTRTDSSLVNAWGLAP